MTVISSGNQISGILSAASTSKRKTFSISHIEITGQFVLAKSVESSIECENLCILEGDWCLVAETTRQQNGSFNCKLYSIWKKTTMYNPDVETAIKRKTYVLFQLLS